MLHVFLVPTCHDVLNLNEHQNNDPGIISLVREQRRREKAYLKEGHWKSMVDFSTFDLIWHNVFAYGYIQVAVE